MPKDRRRVNAILSCSRCRRETPVMFVFPDPNLGGGWPQHRCGYETRPFDICTPTKLTGEPVGKPIKL